MKSLRSIYFLGLAGIVLVYSINYILFQSQLGKLFPSIVLRTAPYLFILLVYIIGIYALRKIPPAWMLAIWHIAHLLLFGVLFFCAIYHQLRTSAPPVGLINLQRSIRETLLSPALYVVMGLLRRYFSALGFSKENN
jgi:hypothetical protein